MPWRLLTAVLCAKCLKKDACDRALCDLQEVNAGGQVVREMIDKKPQKWRFCSTDTVALRETKAWQGLPLFLFEKLDAADPDQWELLEVV